MFEGYTKAPSGQELQRCVEIHQYQLTLARSIAILPDGNRLGSSFEIGDALSMGSSYIGLFSLFGRIPRQDFTSLAHRKLKLGPLALVHDLGTCAIAYDKDRQSLSMTVMKIGLTIRLCAVDVEDLVIFKTCPNG